MPPWSIDLLKWLPGFASPLAFAAVAFGFFHWLEKKASSQAKRAISTYLTPLPYDKAALCSAFVEAFDRVYAYPLLSYRAFVRSCVISIFLLLFYLVGTGRLIRTAYFLGDSHYLLWVAIIVTSNILCDYISLFIVRRSLELDAHRPITALLVGPALGILVIFAFIITRDFSFLVVVRGWRDVLLDPVNLLAQQLLIWLPPRTFVAPTIAVHFWLPLVWLSAVAIRGANVFLKLVHMTQWFLKGGAKHPLDAIAYVSAVFVFVLTVMVQLTLARGG